MVTKRHLSTVYTYCMHYSVPHALILNIFHMHVHTGTITRLHSLELSVWGVLRNPVQHNSSRFILHLLCAPVYKPQVIIITVYLQSAQVSRCAT